MNAAEIAEALLNGNIALAREAILNGNVAYASCAEYAAAVTALDVAAELAGMTNEPGDNTGRALARVRRCLEGAP